MNLKEAFELAFEERETWRNGKGAQTTRINAATCLRILGEDLDISTIKPSTFTKLGRAAMIETARGRTPATANRIMATLHTALTECHLEGELSSVPTYRRFPEPPPLRDTYEKHELQELLEACLLVPEHGKLLQQTLTFCYLTGCRRGEAIKATWDGLDWNKKILTFYDTKNGTHHTITLHDSAIAVLKDMYPERIDQLVFPWCSEWQMNNAVRKLKKLHNLTFRRPVHALRHTCATDLVSAGVDIRAIQALLNHKDITTTLKYADAKQDAIANAVSKLSLD